jgi:ubiquinone/menaquinone biosynthesis C-methylase UbiE
LSARAGPGTIGSVADNLAAPSVAQIFDMLADVYDQTGVTFFGPVGEQLVALLDPIAGERCLDIGCGRGAATIPLARAVGPSGRVDALDVSARMVDGVRALADSAGLANIRVEVGDAADLSGYETGYDVVASSLVLFFLRDPGTALRGWVDRLGPGGRIGLTTFGTLDEPTRAIDALLQPFAPAQLRDPRTAGEESLFATDAGMETLLDAAGAREVRTVTRSTVVEFADVAAWQRFAMSTGQRAMLINVPEADLPGLLAQIGAILESTRQDGPCRLVWQMRYTLGVR